MPTTDAKVLFKAGLKANFNNLAVKDGNTVYFCTDTEQIFVGSSEYTKGGAILAAAPTTTTVGDYGKLYAYNGNLYLCEGLVDGEYKYTRVANVNDVVGSVTSVAIGEGLTTPEGGDNPITSTGTIQHAIATGAEAHTSTAPATKTATFGGTIDLESTSTDKFGHVVGLTTTTVTLPTETELSKETVTGTALTPSYGDKITVVTGVDVANGHVVKPTVTEITLPGSDDTTYTFTSTKEGKVTVTPSTGAGYDVTINGWEDLAKKTELASVFTFKGTVPTIEDLPEDAIIGDVYHVTEASAEYVCIVASTETTDAEYEELGSEIDLSDYALSADVIQRVTGADNAVPKFAADGTLVSTGFTLGVSVPADAKFTDTTYEDATQSVHGLMSTADKTKLDAIEAGGQVNVLEGVQVDGTDLTIDTNKKVNVTLGSFGVTATAAELNDVANKVSKSGDTMTGNLTVTATVTADAFVGPLTGNVTGNLTGNADTATKATQDADGNVITTTYATKSELASYMVWGEF